MRVLKLSNGPGKNGIFFDSVIHAREWIGPSTVMYAINELTENLAANQAMLDNNDFYFLLVTNPDGYEYTWTDVMHYFCSAHTDAFCYMKTRISNRTVSGGKQGVQIMVQFALELTEIATLTTIGETYPGTAPNSEPEIQAFSDFITAETSITFYVAVHSYGSMRVGTEAANAIFAVRGEVYTVGTASNVLYTSYGTSDDWAYGIGLPFSYTIELPGAGNGLDGFNPPPSEILPVAAETWEAFKVIVSGGKQGVQIMVQFALELTGIATLTTIGETYPGTAPNSEPEIQAFSDFITAETSITFYVAVHSYGSLRVGTEAANAIFALRVGTEAANAIFAVRGEVYTVGTASNVLYTSYGTSDDWAYGIGLPFSYTIELPGAGNGLDGFNPPPSEILPVAAETWEAFKVFAANIPAQRQPPPTR
ncbi:hypothetical protein B566_EDAN011981 [Ephemera danica]|nr:hypothetical protein B566_EDAN011981 [Ephemera danica]